MWKKKIKAGILLYALLMAAVFSLLLQFYLNRQVSNQRLQLFNRERTEAYAMAVLTKATAKDDSGEIEFEQGKAVYRKKGKELEISSQISNNLLSLSSAKRLRMSVKILVYVTGFERGIRPMGLWSSWTCTWWSSTSPLSAIPVG